MGERAIFKTLRGVIVGVAGSCLLFTNLPAQTANTAYENTRPAVSPDGNLIAFESNRDGQLEIYLMNRDGTGQTRLTDSPGRDAQPAWSPDGSRLVFVSERGGATDLYIMKSDGSEPTRLTSGLAGANNPRWSPQGRRIAFKSGSYPQADIYLIDADGSNLMNLTPNTDSYEHSPAWSPDGKAIAFTSNRGDPWNVWLMQADGGNPHRLTNNDYTDEIPSWSPDGRAIAYQGRSSGDVQVHRVEADGARPTRLTEGPANNELPVWSPDGRTIYFQSDRGGQWELYSMRADGSAQTRLTLQPADLLARYKGTSLARGIKTLERALLQDPADDLALRTLRTAVSGPFGLDREQRLRLRAAIRGYSHSAHIRLTPAGEPGTPLIVSGTVRNAAPGPVKNAVIYVFQTDAQGLYTPEDGETGSMDEPASRLFGYLRTGPDGRYSFRTIRPGGYPNPVPGLSGDRRFIPQHIHLVASAVGYTDHKCHGTSCQLVFEDDPRMTPAWRVWAKSGGNPVLAVTTDESGVQHCEYDILLHRVRTPPERRIRDQRGKRPPRSR